MDMNAIACLQRDRSHHPADYRLPVLSQTSDAGRLAASTKGQAFAAAVDKQGIVDFITKDGGTRFVESSVTLMRDPKGNAIGFSGFLRDVTERMRLNKLRRDFVANASPERRSPLTVISGYLDSMVDDSYGDLSGQGDCSLPQPLAANGCSYTCTITVLVAADDLAAHGGPDAESIREQTHRLIGPSTTLGRALFGQFLRPLGVRRSRQVLPSR